MINCNWAILCQKSILNAETNNLSLIEILNNYDIPRPPESQEMPFYPFDYEVVVEWQRDSLEKEQDIVFSLEISSPSGRTLLNGQRSVFFGDGVLKIITRLKLQGLPVPEIGFYKFKIQLPKELEEEEKANWETVKEVSLEINYFDFDDEEDIQEEEVDRKSE